MSNQINQRNMTYEITREQAVKIIGDKTTRYQLNKLNDIQLAKLVEYLDNNHYKIIEPDWDEYYKNQYIKWTPMVENDLREIHNALWLGFKILVALTIITLISALLWWNSAAHTK